MAKESDNRGLTISYLQMIEHTYDLTITNKDEVCGWIISATHNPREVLTIALAINNLVAVQNPGRTLTLSKNIIELIIAGTVGRW